MCPICTSLAKAYFEPFIDVSGSGGPRFANRFHGPTWPVFRRVMRRHRPNTRPATGPCGQKVRRSIIKASRIAAARRWIPVHPLLVYQMQVEDARRPGRLRSSASW
jgi:hypothetical protein